MRLHTFNLGLTTSTMHTDETDNGIPVTHSTPNSTVWGRPAVTWCREHHPEAILRTVPCHAVNGTLVALWVLDIPDDAAAVAFKLNFGNVYPVRVPK